MEGDIGKQGILMAKTLTDLVVLAAMASYFTKQLVLSVSAFKREGGGNGDVVDGTTALVVANLLALFDQVSPSGEETFIVLPVRPGYFSVSSDGSVVRSSAMQMLVRELDAASRALVGAGFPYRLKLNVFREDSQAPYMLRLLLRKVDGSPTPSSGTSRVPDS